MKKFDVHVCLISGQPTPNYIPILDKSFRPSEVICLVSGRMEDQYNRLAEMLKKRCPGLIIHKIEIEDVYDLSKAKDQLLNIISPMHDAKKSIVLNGTGGNKLMAFEALDFCRDLEIPSFYFKSENNEIRLLQDREDFLLNPDKINIDDYLYLHGYSVNDTEVFQLSSEKIELFKKLTDHPSIYQEGLATLNFDIYKKRLTSNTSHKDDPLMMTLSRDYDANLLDLFEDAGLLKRKGEKVEFSSEDSVNFINGGWFEEYVYSVVRKLPNIQGSALNLQLVSDNGKITNTKKSPGNEIDVCFMNDNILHLIECKTASYKDNPDGRERGINALYKLQALKALGGLKTRTIFISYQDIPEFMRRRAKAQDIKIITGAELKNTQLRSQLLNWDKLMGALYR